jgi:hypothetical protein
MLLRGGVAPAGFTLFEVALSLAALTVGIVSVLMLLPMGIKAQQLSRYQLLAAAKAIDVMSVNTNQWRKWDKQLMESHLHGANTINSVAHAPLAEQKASNWRHGSLPLPPEIARRLDSENDEIANLLAEGGQLFYASPRPNSSIAEDLLVVDDRVLPNEASRLVYAVVGYAQQYALVNHPNKAWPYYDWYPVVPRGRPASRSPFSSRHEDAWVLSQSQPPDKRWPGLDEFRALAARWQSLPVAPAPGPTDITVATAYRDLAKLLVTAVGMSVDADGIPELPPGTPLDRVPPYRVLAASYLAHAMTWLTSPGFTPAPLPGDAADYARQAQRAHEVALAWAKRYATTDPYDWGADRPINFQNAWDHPLLQAQLFSGTTRESGLATLLRSTAISTDVGWPVVSASPVNNAGCAHSFHHADSRHATNVANLKASFGDPATFNLTNRFAASERCRQLVFWAVDWQSYEDYEAVPSAPLDAGKFAHDSAGTVSYNNGAHKFGNPEVFFVWRDASRRSLGDQGAALGDRAVFLGMHGADRNGNGRFDRGPTPASVRLRATVVGRFNFYNPRVWCGLKN